MKTFTELSKKEQQKVVSETSYDLESLKINDLPLIPESEIDEYLVDQFFDAYSVNANVAFYLDNERIAQDMKMDYTSVELDGQTYYFEAF